MAHIRIVIDGQVQLSRNLRIFTNSLENLGGFYREALDIVKTRSDKVFSAEGKNVEKSNKWAKLAPSTLNKRKKRWSYYQKSPASNAGVLTWTGNLRNNVVKRVRKQYGTLTYKSPYAIYHHRGGGKLPKRAIIDLSRETNAKIVKALQKNIHKKMGVFGRQL